MLFFGDILFSFKIFFGISNNIEYTATILKESSYSICENVWFLSKKMFFACHSFLKLFRMKSSARVHIKVVFLHLLSQNPGF